MTVNSRILVICIIAIGIALNGCAAWRKAEDPPDPAENDMFFDAVTITKPGSVNGTIYGATREYGEVNHGSGDSRVSVWWRYAADANGTLTVTAESGEFDPTVVAYYGVSVDALQIPAGAVRSKPSTGQSRVAFRISAGNTYHIAVLANSGATGELTLQIQDSSWRR